MSDRFGNIEIDKPASPGPVKGKETPRRVQGSRPRKAKPSRKPRKGLSKIWVWVGVIAIIFVIYAGIGFVGVPYYFTKLFPAHYYENTGITFEADDVRFNPFNFNVSFGPVQIIDETGEKIIGFNSLTSSLRPLSLLRRDMVCNQVTIDSPEVFLTRERNGRYNIKKIIGESTSIDDSEIMHFSDLPFFFSLNNITVRNGKIVFKDLPAAKKHIIEDIEFELPTFSNIPVKTDSYLRPHFAATINGSPIELTGQAKISETGDDSEVSKLTCALDDIDLQPYINYLPFELPFIFTRGVAKGSIDLTFDPSAPEGTKFSFGFDLQLSNTELFSKDKKIQIVTPAALLKGSLLPVSKTLAFSTIIINKPAVQSHGAFLSNLNALLNNAPQADTVSPPKTPVNLEIKLLKVEGGLVSLFAKNNPKKAHSTWKSFHLSIKDYSSAEVAKNKENSGSIHISGKHANSRAHFIWDGIFDSKELVGGKFSLQQYDSHQLFKNINVTELQGLRGLASLEGQLELYTSKEKAPKLEYRLHTTDLTIQNLKVVDRKHTLLTAQLLKSSSLSKTSNGLALGAVSIEGGALFLSKGKTPAILANFTKKSSKLSLDSLSYSGKVTFTTERKLKRRIVFPSLTIKADSLTNKKAAKNNFELIAKSDKGKELIAQGTLQLTPFSLSSEIIFNKIALQNLLPIFSNTVVASSTHGLIAGNGKLKLPKLSFTGELKTSKTTVDNPDLPQLSWQQAVFTDVNYTNKPFHLGIDNVQISEPDLYWYFASVNGNPLTSLRSFFQSHFAPQPTSTKGSKKRISLSPLDIQSISLSNGKVTLVDQRLTPNWRAQVENFTGKLTDIHFAKSAKLAPFSFTGSLDNVAFTLSGDADLFGDNNNSNFSFTISDYPLASFKDQISSREDFDTSQTTFDLTLKTARPNGITQKSGEVVFSGIKALSPSSETALTLALLSNAENQIKLDYSFQPEEAGKEIALFDQLVSLFDTTIVKGAVSPLLLAQGDFTDLIGNEFVEFTPGEFMLSSNGREMLARYTALLIAHPRIGLILSGGHDNVKDHAAITAQLEMSEQQRVTAINDSLYNKWQEQKDEYDRKLAAQKKKLQRGETITEIDIPKALLEGFTPIVAVPVVVDDVMLLELAEKRLEITSQFFTTQLALEPGRLTITPASSIQKMTDPQANGVAISLRPIVP